MMYAMKEAFNDVKRGLDVRKAPRILGVLESTLRLIRLIDLLSKGEPRSKMGCPTMFTYK